MQIRKNTRPYKTIVSILSACQNRADRQQLVRLFITKAGQTVDDRIAIEGIQTNADLFYEMTYQALLTNLQSPSHQLHESDDLSGLYFLRGSNKTWDETPFEFSETIATEFASLGEPPNVRKKGAVTKYTLPTAKDTGARHAVGKIKAKTKKPAKVVKMTVSAPRQPSVGLKKPIEFTGLDRLVFKQKGVDKLAILEYYHKIADYLLPWLKDRILWVREQSDVSRELVSLDIDEWAEDEHIPDWVDQRTIPGDRHPMLCNDKDHLFFYLEKGYVEFSPSHSHLKSASPDYMVIGIDAPDFAKVIDVALVAKEILEGLRLPSFIKTDGVSGFHVYVPLEVKGDFDTCVLAAAYICKLVRLKIPDLATLNTEGELTYGKVSLDYTLNAADRCITAPYSIVSGPHPVVTTPLSWDEVKPGLKADDFDLETVVKRLRQGDPFKNFYKKKVNAGELLALLSTHYSFLL